MTTHTLEPERRTLHGHFSRDLPPILEITPGDTVIYRTLDAGWGIAERAPDGTRPKFEPRNPELDRGHALVGPITIRGAEPGMTLEVQIGELRTGRWGWTSSGGWPHEIHQRLGTADVPERLIDWTLDPIAQMAQDDQGREIALRPFMGVMGMPEDAPGVFSTSPPRVNGGNLDCKELVSGTSLFLPIAVPGGLFSVGDGHGVQGDGEVCVTAIECPMEKVELTFFLHPQLNLKTPRARTAEGWLTLGFSEDLDEAAFRALDAMLDLIAEHHACDRNEALALASLVVDLRITQICNGVKGVHALLPHTALRHIDPSPPRH